MNELDGKAQSSTNQHADRCPTILEAEWSVGDRLAVQVYQYNVGWASQTNYSTTIEDATNLIVAMIKSFDPTTRPVHVYVSSVGLGIVLYDRLKGAAKNLFEVYPTRHLLKLKPISTMPRYF